MPWPLPQTDKLQAPKRSNHDNSILCKQCYPIPQKFISIIHLIHSTREYKIAHSELILHYFKSGLLHQVLLKFLGDTWWSCKKKIRKYKIIHIFMLILKLQGQTKESHQGSHWETNESVGHTYWAWVRSYLRYYMCYGGEKNQQ